MMASELESHSVFGPSARYPSTNNHSMTAVPFRSSSPPPSSLPSNTLYRTSSQIQSLILSPTTVFVAPVSGEDGSCGCPYIGQSSTISLVHTSLPKSLEGLYTYSQYTSFVQRLNRLLERTHCPLCPCSLFMLCLPFSPLCASIYCRSRRLNGLQELLNKENAQSPLADQGLEWVLTYHPDFSTLEDSGPGGGKGGGGGLSGTNSVENSRNRSPGFSSPSSFPSRSFAVLRIIPTIRFYYETQHPEVRQLMAEMSSKQRQAEFEAACMAEIDAEMIEEGLLSQNSQLGDRSGIGGSERSRNRQSYLHTAAGGGGPMHSTLKLASSPSSFSPLARPLISSSHTVNGGRVALSSQLPGISSTPPNFTPLTAGEAITAAAPPPAVMGERMDAEVLAAARVAETEMGIMIKDEEENQAVIG